ncbi:BON domain-containing protein [Sinorhizobium americanum]|uniref:BON domain-containing protein n=1 Tax=Sinorhizobium americanum TaxID=194963 RepID=A0A4R2BY74_9HYPH|nr:BON domain-containing protein [Sinorhizobium americanum]TCN32053.1 BON domain-containing protein [Sinorhizobium americanum]
MARRKEWRQGDPDWRSREAGRDWYGDERRSRRHFAQTVEPRGADYENSEYFPDAESGAGPYRRMGEDYGRWNRDRGYGDYGSDYGDRGRSSYSRSGRDWDEERGFFERAGDEVASWFGDEDAERRRQMDQHRGKGPKGYTRSDSRIQEDVSDRLSDDGALDASEIEVSVTGGEVQLSGFVESKWSKRRAEDLAENVSGVSHVQNNIRVRGAGGTTSGTSGWNTGGTTQNL